MDVLKSKRQRWKLVAGFAGITILLVWPQATYIGKQSVRTSIAPSEEVGAWASRRFTNWGKALRGLSTAAEREQQLSLELVRTQAELNRLQDIELENQRLLRALGFQQATPYKLTPATVISRNISGWWNTLRIQPSSKKSLHIDSAVLSPDGLVGRVLEVNPLSAEVLLVCDPAFRVAARISGREIFGVVRGMGNSISGQPLVRMEFINKDSVIQIGEEVTTSSSTRSEGFFPPGIHIGYIKQLHRDESGLFQYAEIVPRATGGLLDYLFVVGNVEETP
ncbi:MAG TPA: hypothetical protein DD620_01965 [Verrucomicrobia bacterium]|nr:hypothetical protein [Kiritimatiellaceae bacterium]HBO87504.1 hypothetical protein [Verrucomicrobiota bacterium]